LPMAGSGSHQGCRAARCAAASLRRKCSGSSCCLPFTGESLQVSTLDLLKTSDVVFLVRDLVIWTRTLGASSMIVEPSLGAGDALFEPCDHFGGLGHAASLTVGKGA